MCVDTIRRQIGFDGDEAATGSRDPQHGRNGRAASRSRQRHEITGIQSRFLKLRRDASTPTIKFQIREGSIGFDDGDGVLRRSHLIVKPLRHRLELRLEAISRLKDVKLDVVFLTQLLYGTKQ